MNMAQALAALAAEERERFGDVYGRGGWVSQRKRATSLVSLAEIKCEIARIFDVSVMDLEGPRRWDELSKARFAAYYLARRLTRKTLLDISAAFGRERSTVHRGLRCAKKLMKSDNDFWRAVIQAESQLRGEPVVMFKSVRS